MTTFIFTALVALAFAAGDAHAHRLIVNCQVLTGQKVQVVCLFSDPFRSFPARGVEVKVLGPDDRVVFEGNTDDKGGLVFPYGKVEELRVKVSQEDHEAEVTIPAEKLEAAKRGNPTGGNDEPGTNVDPRGDVISSANNGPRGEIKDVLLGVTFLLALGAFVLSVRNARRLREVVPPPSRHTPPAAEPSAPGSTEPRG